MPNHVMNIVRMDGIANLPLFTKNQYEGLEFDFNKLIPMPESLNLVSGSIEDIAIDVVARKGRLVPANKLGPVTQEIKDKIEKLLALADGSNENESKAAILKAKELMAKYGYFPDDIRATLPYEILERHIGRIAKMTAEEKKAVQKVIQRKMSDEWYEGSLKGRRENVNELFELGCKYISNQILYGATTWYDWCCNNWGTKWNAYETEILDDNAISFWTAWSNPEPILLKLAQMYPDLVIEHMWADEDKGSNTGTRYLHASQNIFDVDFHSHDDAALRIYEECWGSESDNNEDDLDEDGDS